MHRARAQGLLTVLRIAGEGLATLWPAPTPKKRGEGAAVELRFLPFQLYPLNVFSRIERMLCVRLVFQQREERGDDAEFLRLSLV